MPSLTDRPELVGFFSYSREDDEDSQGALSALRNRIQRELRGQLGRSARDFRLCQDREAIAPGTLWEAEIKAAVEQSVFFIPIVTPTAVRSEFCRFEFESFLARERALGRSDLIFPILYIRVPALEDRARWEVDPVLSMIARRQYVDWQEFRYLDVNSTPVSQAIGLLGRKIVEALLRPDLADAEKERRRQQEEDQWRQEDQHQAPQDDQRLRAEQEHRRKQAEEEQRREREARQQAEEQRRRQQPSPPREPLPAENNRDGDRSSHPGRLSLRRPVAISIGIAVLVAILGLSLAGVFRTPPIQRPTPAPPSATPNLSPAGCPEGFHPVGSGCLRNSLPSPPTPAPPSATPNLSPAECPEGFHPVGSGCLRNSLSSPPTPAPPSASPNLSPSECPEGFHPVGSGCLRNSRPSTMPSLGHRE
jgi:hypothetical protein